MGSVEDEGGLDGCFGAFSPGGELVGGGGGFFGSLGEGREAGRLDDTRRTSRSLSGLSRCRSL